MFQLVTQGIFLLSVFFANNAMGNDAKNSNFNAFEETCFNWYRDYETSDVIIFPGPFDVYINNPLFVLQGNIWDVEYSGIQKLEVSRSNSEISLRRFDIWLDFPTPLYAGKYSFSGTIASTQPFSSSGEFLIYPWTPATPPPTTTTTTTRPSTTLGPTGGTATTEEPHDPTPTSHRPCPGSISSYIGFNQTDGFVVLNEGSWWSFSFTGCGTGVSAEFSGFLDDLNVDDELKDEMIDTTSKSLMESSLNAFVENSLGGSMFQYLQSNFDKITLFEILTGQTLPQPTGATTPIAK